MVRRCAIPNCKSTDLEVLSHRFPRNTKLANTWRESLNLQDYTVEELLSKYVVCTLHFDRSDYRNELSNNLNSTAIPKINGINPRIIMESAGIENESPIREELMKSNDEILILSHEDVKSLSDGNNEDNLIQSFESGEYDKINFFDIESFPASISSLQMLEDPPNDEEMQNESDVEILLNDNIIGSDGDTEEEDEGRIKFKTGSSISQISFEIENLNSDFSCQVDLDEVEKINLEDEEYSSLSRLQLIEHIREQKSKILDLENKIKTFQNVHNQLVLSLDTVRTMIGDC